MSASFKESSSEGDSEAARSASDLWNELAGENGHPKGQLTNQSLSFL